MKPSLDIERYIRELRSTLGAAQQNFEIWWIYKSADTRPQYIDTMNRYVGFFRVSIHAHFLANIIALYRLYETRSDTINLISLSKTLPPEKRVALPSDFKSRMSQASAIWKKIAIIRNNCFGHLNGEKGVSELFALAKLSPNEMKELMELTKGLLNDLSHAWNGSVHAFNLNPYDDTIQLLNDLNSLALRS